MLRDYKKKKTHAECLNLVDAYVDTDLFPDRKEQHNI